MQINKMPVEYEKLFEILITVNKRCYLTISDKPPGSTC